MSAKKIAKTAKVKKKGSGKAKRILRKVLLWTFTIILVLFLGLIIIAALFEERIGRMVINELNKSLKTELQVEKAELSLIWGFPNASVKLQNVRIEGVVGDEPLAKLESVTLKCGIMGLLSGNYDFKSVSLSNGSITVYNDAKGLANYDVFVTGESDDSGGAESSEGLNIAIQNANLYKVNLRYWDEKADQDFDILVNNAYFSGKFTDAKFDMKSYAEMESNRIQIGESTYLEGKEIAYDAVIGIDNVNNKYTFTEVSTTVEGNEFSVDGAITSLDEGTDLDLKFSSSKVRLNSILRLLPNSYLAYLGGFESYADLYLSAEVKGTYSDTKIPYTDVSFGLKKGNISHEDMAEPFKNVGFDVQFTAGDPKKGTSFEINNFSASLGGNPINLSMSSKGMNNPKVSFALDGVIPLKSMYGWLGEQVTAGKGKVNIEALTLEGRYDDMINPSRISRVRLGGKLIFDGASLRANGVDIGVESGSMSLQNNVFKIQALALKGTESDIILDGEFSNVLPVLFADKQNSKRAELTFNSSLTASKIDVEKLLQALENPTNIEVDETDEVLMDSLTQKKFENREYITQFLKGSFVTNIGEINYGKIKATNFSGLLEFNNNVMSVQNLKVDAMDGTFELNSKIYFEKEPKLEAFFDCEGANVHELLYQFDNFGQNTIKDRHLQGSLEALVHVQAFWDEYGNFKDNELKVVADINLTNGELLGFEMLEDFAAYIKLKTLRRMKFSDLHNQFRIENKTFHMPAMLIRSNALNLVVSGKHTFDQDIDYMIKVNGGQVLAQMFKKHNPNMEPLKAKKKGSINIYRRIRGNLDSGEDLIFDKGAKINKYLLAEMERNTIGITNHLKTEFTRAAPSGEAMGAPKLAPIEEPEEWGDLTGENIQRGDINEWD